MSVPSLLLLSAFQVKIHKIPLDYVPEEVVDVVEGRHYVPITSIDVVAMKPSKEWWNFIKPSINQIDACMDAGRVGNLELFKMIIDELLEDPRIEEGYFRTFVQQCCFSARHAVNEESKKYKVRGEKFHSEEKWKSIVEICDAHIPKPESIFRRVPMP